MNPHILIVDDSIHDLAMEKDEICSLLSLQPGTSECETYTEMPPHVDVSAYDFIILDIDMPGINGFDLAEQIHHANKEAVIMFCSNHDELVFDSFRLNTFYFIRKSVFHQDMIDAIRKFQALHNEKNQCYVLSFGSQIQKIPYDSIVYFEVTGNDLFIKTVSNEYHERRTLKSIIDVIPANVFVQPMQNHMVNLNFISRIEKNSIILKDGSKLSISRLYLDNVKKSFLDHISNQ